MSYQEIVAEDCRLVILKALGDEPDHRLNETILTMVLEKFGHLKSREYVRTQIRKLEELGAVKVSEAGTVLVPQLLQPGLNHLQRRAFIEGVGRPSLES